MTATQTPLRARIRSQIRHRDESTSRERRYATSRCLECRQSRQTPRQPATRMMPVYVAAHTEQRGQTIRHPANIEPSSEPSSCPCRGTENTRQQTWHRRNADDSPSCVCPDIHNTFDAAAFRRLCRGFDGLRMPRDTPSPERWLVLTSTVTICPVLHVQTYAADKAR